MGPTRPDPTKPFLDALTRIHRVQRCPRLRAPHHARMAAWVERRRVAAEDALEGMG